MAHHIIKQHPKLVHAVNEDGISALHLLASRPDSFPSRTHLSGLLPKIVYYCELLSFFLSFSSTHQNQIGELNDMKLKHSNFCKVYVLGRPKDQMTTM